MADIFLSYTRADATRAGQLAQELEARGFAVFWDTEILPGQRWRDVIHDELVDAACVIVIWSSESGRSRWVVEEASEALEAGKLVPVLLDGTLPPFGFRGVEAANLTGWIPGSASSEFENLVNAVRGIIGTAMAADTAPGGAPSGSGEGTDPSPAGGVGTVGDDGPPEGSPVDAAYASSTGVPPDAAAVGDHVEPEATVVEDRAGSGAPPAEERPSPTGPTEQPAPSPPWDAGTTPPLPPGEGIAGRLGAGGLAAIGIVAALIVVVIVVLAGGNGDDGVEPDSTGAGGTTTSTAGTTEVEAATVESDTVTAFRAGSAPVIDGDLGEWSTVPERYHLRQEVFRDPAVTERLGDDSSGIVAAQYDDTFLYLAVVTEDDVYSQLNTGNQIWRGDALDINLTTAGAGAASERPDGDDFQLTMTPRDAEGGTATVWFTGNGSGFADNTTGQPVRLAGVVDAGGSWQLEAAIPWSVFGLSGPPATELAALVAVFDNDGEVVDGVPRQTVILGHTSAEFQRPRTWGTLRLEP